MRETCVFTVASLTNSRLAISALLSPRAARRKITGQIFAYHLPPIMNLNSSLLSSIFSGDSGILTANSDGMPHCLQTE